MRIKAKFSLLQIAIISACAISLGADLVERDSSGFRERFYTKQIGNSTIVRDGPYQRFYNSGAKAEDGKYSEGIRDGVWTEWFENGEKSRILTWNVGKMNGPYTRYEVSGALLATGLYSDDKRTGVWRLFNASTAVLEEGTYLDGLKNGDWTQKQTIAGDTLIESVGRFTDGKKDGRWIVRMMTSKGVALTCKSYNYAGDILADSTSCQ